MNQITYDTQKLQSISNKYPGQNENSVDPGHFTPEAAAKDYTPILIWSGVIILAIFLVSIVILLVLILLKAKKK